MWNSGKPCWGCCCWHLTGSRRVASKTSGRNVKCDSMFIYFEVKTLDSQSTDNWRLSSAWPVLKLTPKPTVDLRQRGVANINIWLAAAVAAGVLWLLPLDANLLLRFQVQMSLLLAIKCGTCCPRSPATPSLAPCHKLREKKQPQLE